MDQLCQRVLKILKYQNTQILHTDIHISQTLKWKKNNEFIEANM